MRVKMNAGQYFVHVRASVAVTYPQKPVVINITKSNFPGKIPPSKLRDAVCMGVCLCVNVNLCSV